MASVRKRNKGELSKVKYSFEVGTLDVLLKYIQCEYVSEEEKGAVRKLVTNIDIEEYRAINMNVYMRLKTLEVLTECVTVKGITDKELLLIELNNSYESGIEIINSIGIGNNLLKLKECEYIKSFVNEKNQYLDVYRHKDKVIRLLSNIEETADYNTSYYDTFLELKTAVSELLIALNTGNSNNEGLLEEFSFSDNHCAEMLTNVLNKAKKPTSILQTGIRQLNALLSPGFHGGRLYTILGGSGRFKSGTLLNIADQIRLFNPQVKPFENGKRKCVLFVSLENSIEETIERIYDMYSGMDDTLRDKEPYEILETLRNESGLEFSNDPSDPKGGIDIVFKYRKNLSIKTSDIYQMIDDLSNRGYEVIAIVVDYIKRLESDYKSNGDERIRMSNVGKELKSMAQFYQRPVITAMQLNRSGNALLDDAVRDSKQDITRFVGSSSIGNAWDIVEDSDWVGIVNLEMQKSTNRLFLTFKRVKIRGKKDNNALETFNHPFSNAKNIRLAPDVNLPEPLSVHSLSTDLDSVDEESGMTSSGMIIPSIAKKHEARTSDKIRMHLSNI